MIVIDMTKAKAIAHGKRRVARAAEFAPLDDAIAKQLPGVDAQAVEAERQVVREKYAAMQEAIEAAATVEEIKAVLPQE